MQHVYLGIAVFIGMLLGRFLYDCLKGYYGSRKDKGSSR